MPRPKLNPTEEQRKLVKQLAAVGTPQEHIARKTGIRSPKTLRKHFRKELDLGAIEANASVAGELYKKAMSGNFQAQAFWLERRAGWSLHKFPSATSAAPPPFLVTVEEKVA